MGFIGGTKPQKPSWLRGTGNLNASIMIVADYPDKASIKSGNAFDGPSLTVLESCLHQAGLTKAEVFMTALRYDKSHVDDLWNRRTKPKRELGGVDAYFSELKEEILRIKPKVVAASGELVCHRLTGKSSLMMTRGYPFISKIEDHSFVTVPILEPYNMVWSNYIWRLYLSHDFTKIKRYAANGFVPLEYKVHQDCSFAEYCAFLDIVASCGRTSIDIEVSNFEVSCIGFTLDNTTAVSVPFDERWTEDEEVILWNRVARILESEKIEKIGQNNIFDIYFLVYKMGIFLRNLTIDTMMSHSIMYPDFLKSLNFLASIYTDIFYWKDMVNFKNIKQEA